MADEIYIDEQGRRRIGRERPQKIEPRTGYVSPLWPPPGHPAAAHRPECGKGGRGCVCNPLPDNVRTFGGRRG